MKHKKRLKKKWEVICIKNDGTIYRGDVFLTKKAAKKYTAEFMESTVRAGFCHIIPRYELKD